MGTKLKLTICVLSIILAFTLTSFISYIFAIVAGFILGDLFFDLTITQGNKTTLKDKKKTK
jgi:hypothetical protein